MDYTQILQLLIPVFEAYIGKYGPVIQALTIVGSLRLGLKPIFAAVEKFIYDTETKADDEVLNKVKDSKVTKFLTFVLDYLASIKLPR